MNVNHEDVYDLPKSARESFSENEDYATRLDDQWDYEDDDPIVRKVNDTEELERLEQEKLLQHEKNHQEALERLEDEGGRYYNHENEKVKTPQK
jgi:hypothetical protein